MSEAELIQLKSSAWQHLLSCLMYIVQAEFLIKLLNLLNDLLNVLNMDAEPADLKFSSAVQHFQDLGFSKWKWNA